MPYREPGSAVSRITLLALIATFYQPGLPTAAAERVMEALRRGTVAVRREDGKALRIFTTNPQQCGGRPCIRGMRIRVSDVLNLLANGLSEDDVLKELPDLERDDIRAVLEFASRRVDHPVIRPC